MSNSNNANNSLANMMNETDNKVEEMMNAIMNNGNNKNKSAKNGKKKNKSANNGSNNSNNSDNENNKNKIKNKNNSMFEIRIMHPETDKMMTLKIEKTKNMDDLKKLLKREAQVSTRKYIMIIDEGEGDIDDMKKVSKDMKLADLHTKKLQFKEKNRTFTLSEPLIKFKGSKGKKMDQENPYGKFEGKFPSVAARKAANGIIHSMGLEGKDIFKLKKFKFGLIEITRNSTNEVRYYYGYNALTKTVTKNINGKKIPQSIDAKVIKITDAQANNKANNMGNNKANNMGNNKANNKANNMGNNKANNMGNNKANNMGNNMANNMGNNMANKNNSKNKPNMNNK